MRIQSDISVCVVSRDRPEALAGFLRSLLREADPVLIEVIVIDNGSITALATLLGKEFPQVTFLEMGRTEAWPVAVNRGLDLAAGRYLAVFDDGFVAQPGCLQPLLTYLDDHPEIGLAGLSSVFAGLVMRREMLDEVGLFDEGFCSPLVLRELCRRCRRAGWRGLDFPSRDFPLPTAERLSFLADWPRYAWRWLAMILRG